MEEYLHFKSHAVCAKEKAQNSRPVKNYPKFNFHSKQHDCIKSTQYIL